jgi:putative ABC transport system substrate-binding protein
VRRRDLIALVTASLATPVAVRAQQSSTPIVGFLHSASSSYLEHFAPAVREGLKETGYVEGRNVVIEYRAADGRYDRLPDLAADLIGRKVVVILAAGGSEPAKAAKQVSATTPIVFVTAGDPIAAGLVASLSRPGGNLTGVSLLGAELEPKRLELLNELVPGEAPIGVLVNPGYPDADRQAHELAEAAAVLKRQISIARASTEEEVDAAVAKTVQQRAGAMLIAQDPFFISRRERLVWLMAHYKLPAIYFQRNFTEIGGLISYGADFADGYRLAGVDVGKILQGTSPADLPVVQSAKFELVINMKTAKALGITVPQLLLGRADEVIE